MLFKLLFNLSLRKDIKSALLNLLENFQSFSVFSDECQFIGAKTNTEVLQSISSYQHKLSYLWLIDAFTNDSIGNCLNHNSVMFAQMLRNHQNYFNAVGVPDVQLTYLWTHMRTSKNNFQFMELKNYFPKQNYATGHNVRGPVVSSIEINWTVEMPLESVVDQIRPMFDSLQWTWCKWKADVST